MQPRTVLSEIRAHLEELAHEVDARRRDAGFQAALEAMALFWRYSVCNQWLIRRQLPTATRVAGRRTWEKLGRRPKPGARPLEILAPTRNGFPFVVVPVYDISQTRGRKVPTLDLHLRGRTRRYRLLEDAATRLGIAVEPLPPWEHCLGRCLGGRIQIRPGLSQRERAAVLAHELAHELLHQLPRRRREKRPPKSVVETEAEATSYVLLRALGLPSKAPTYIAWQGGDGAKILRSLARIQQAASRILKAAQAALSRSPHAQFTDRRQT